MPSQRPKNSIMCSQCRKDKQRCDPDSYNYENGEKCSRCKDKNFACSKPVKKVRSKKRPRLLAGATGNYIISSSRQLDLESNLRQMLASDTQVITAGIHPVSNQPVDIANAIIFGNRGRPLPVPFDFRTESPVSQLSNEDIGTDNNRKSYEIQARCLTTTLRNLFAVRKLLERDLECSILVRQWIGMEAICNAIITDIQHKIDLVVNKFYLGMRQAASLVKVDMGGHKSVFCVEILLLREKFLNIGCAPLSRLSSMQTSSLISPFEEEVFNLQKRSNIYSAVYHVVEDLPKLGITDQLSANSEKEYVRLYEKTVEDINDSLSDLSTEPGDRRDSNGVNLSFNSRVKVNLGCSPCHIAAHTASQSILLRLHKLPADLPFGLDYLNRTPIHIAAYNGCVARFELIFRHNNNAIRYLQPDIYGLTPLAIAACNNDLVSFEVLCRYGIDLETQDCHGKSVLDLAIINESHSIVRHMTKLPNLSPRLLNQILEIQWDQTQIPQSETAADSLEDYSYEYYQHGFPAPDGFPSISNGLPWF